MLTRIARRVAFVTVVAAVVVLARVWPDDASRHTVVGRSSSGDVPPGVSDTTAAVGSSTATAVRSTPRVTEAPRPSTQAPVRVEVHAPSEVRVGDVFQARVDIQANGAVRDLIFSIAYEKSRLSLVGRSDGEFVRQPGVPSDFGVDEPSDGYIEIVYRARNGSLASGAGTIMVLEFEATRPGTSGIELQNVKATDAGGHASPNDIVAPARVTIR